jgi:hypothetical protein
MTALPSTTKCFSAVFDNSRISEGVLCSYARPEAPSLGYGAPTAIDQVSGRHPMRYRCSISMSTTCASSCPSCDRSQKRGCRQRECQDNGAAARAGNRGFCVRDNAIYATFGFSSCEACCTTNLLNQVCPVVSAHTVMSRRRKEYSARLRSLGTQISIGRAAGRAVQAIKFVAKQRPPAWP